MIHIQMSNQNMICKDYNFHQSGTLYLLTDSSLCVYQSSDHKDVSISESLQANSKHAAYELATITSKMYLIFTSKTNVAKNILKERILYIYV